MDKASSFKKEGNVEVPKRRPLLFGQQEPPKMVAKTKNDWLSIKEVLAHLWLVS